MASVITDEDEYGMRCGLIVEKTEDALRRKFHKKFPKDPILLFEGFDRLRDQIKKLQRKKLISKDDYELLLPKNGRCDSDKYDASLLKKLLQKFCGYERADNKPKASDNSIDANIYRATDIRNKIKHGPVKVSKEAFETLLQESKQPLLKLGCTEEEIDEISTIVIADKKTKETIEKLEQPSKDFSYNFLAPVPNFIGRDVEIDQIHLSLVTAYEDVMSDNPLLGVVVSGISGVGKSELVRQYWFRYHNEFYDDIIMWINARTIDSMTNAFLEIGEGLKINMKQKNGLYQPIESIVQKVYNHFVLTKSSEHQRKILFVFDGLDNPDNIKPFLPCINNSPYIVVTSQRNDWEQFKVVELSVFTRETSEMFLKNNVKNPHSMMNEEDNKHLQQKLDGHPLALQQAISYINIQNMTVGNYCELFEEECIRLLQINPDIHSKPALITILLSIAKLKQRNDSEVAVEILNKSAYLDGNNIKKGLLLMFTDESKLQQALKLLSTYSFIKNQSEVEQSIFEQQLLTVHPLIQMTMKFEHFNIEETKNHIDEMLEVFFKQLNDEPEIINKGKYWFNHFVHMFDSKETKDNLLLGSFKEQNVLIDVFEKEGRLPKFLEILQAMVEITPNVSKAECLQIPSNISETLKKLGRYHEGLLILKELEKQLESLFKLNHPMVVTTQNNIANTLIYLGKHKEALKILIEIEKNKKSNFEVASPMLFPLTQYNIANAYIDNGKYEKAHQLLVELDKKYSNVLSENYILLSVIKHDIVQTLLYMKRYKDALNLARSIEEKDSLSLGKNHPVALKTQCSIADALMHLGEYKESLNLLKKIEKEQLSVFGENHPDVLNTQNSIAAVLIPLRRYDEALDILEKLEIKLLADGKWDQHLSAIQFKIAEIKKRRKKRKGLRK